MFLSFTGANYFLALTLIQEGPSDFGDLGKLLFVGVLAAIALAIAVTLIRLRFRDKKPEKGFISISSFQRKD